MVGGLYKSPNGMKRRRLVKQQCVWFNIEMHAEATKLYAHSSAAGVELQNTLSSD